MGSDAGNFCDSIRNSCISIRTPAWGATIQNVLIKQRNYYFNPHSHVGSDLLLWLYTYRTVYFNPHSHEGSDSATALSSVSRCCISIHTPAWGATKDYPVIEQGTVISIHTPAWGATSLSNKLVSGKQFQSTLPRGERRSLQGILLWFSYFNPHSHEGSDDLKSDTHQTTAISIHTPTRGATGILKKTVYTEQFQSTLPRGERRTQMRILKEIDKFQSTLPRGERRWKSLYILLSSDFNPTLPRGERPDEQYLIWCDTNISIHTPTRGATFHMSLPCSAHSISIHTPTRGATL